MVVVPRLRWDTGGWGRPGHFSVFLSPHNSFACCLLQCLRMDRRAWDIIFCPSRLLGHASPSIDPAEIKLSCFSYFQLRRLACFPMAMFSFTHWSRSVIQAFSWCALFQRGVIEIGRLNHLDLLNFDRSKEAASGDRWYCASSPIQMAYLLFLPIVMIPLVMV